MIAHVKGTVLHASDRTAADGKTYSDLYILQPGERNPVVAYADGGVLVPLPTSGECVEAVCTVWSSKFAGGGLSVKVTALSPAPLASPYPA